MSTATGFNSSGALGTVKSVGLTMPDAFTVENSPITESGVIGVTLEGTASQYVRGDGQLAQLPTISGGGGGQVYYLNGGTSQGTIGGSAFEQLSPAATIGTEVDFTSTTADLQDFVNFITDAGTPDQETVPAGSWIFQCYFSATAPTAQVYATVEVWNGTSFNGLGASLAQTLSSGATTDLYTFTVAIPEYNPLVPTDRIAVRFYALNLLGVNTVTLHTQNSYLGSIQTTFTTGLSALNGLTKPSQYLSAGTSGTDFAISSADDTHTFNLPTASASNRGALSSSDWSTFNGKQNALTIGNLTDGGTDGIIVTGGTGAVIGTGASISQQKADGTHNGYLSSTDWTTFNSKGVGSVTSVGMTVPSALSVTPSSITSSGTFAITGAGTASQYIRGDGALAVYNPGSGGGGASQAFYFNGSVASGVTGYQQMSTAANTGASSDFSVSANGYIASFLTDSGSPNQLLIPAGNWNFEIYMNANSNAGNPYFHVELYKYNGSTFTLISSSATNPEYITNGTQVDLYTTALTVPTTTLLTTDRLAVRVYVNVSGRTITMHTQDSNLSEVITTFTTGITALNGLTAQVQNFATGTSGTDFNISSVTSTHTFNIPTASASKRGALSSADWSTFNGKQDTITATSQQTFVNALSASPAPLDTMMVQVTDPADTAVKKFSWANFKVYLLNYFDTIFPRITTSSTGSVITFNVPVIWNTPASPSASNLTDDLTGAKIGYVQKIYHNKSVAPTVPAGWVLIGTGTYTISTLNIIFAEWVSGTRVEYWITKPA